MTVCFDDDEMLKRARRAYYRSGGHDIPAGDGDIHWVKKQPFALLANGRGPLAVFAIKATKAGPRLKRLEALPKELERFV